MMMRYRLFWLTLPLLFICLQALPAVFTVTSNADSGPGTLHEALDKAAANGSAVQDVINFNLPGTDLASRTIILLTQLPNVSSNLIIDGSTQPGAKLGKSDAKVVLLADINFDSPGVLPGGLILDGVKNVEIYGLSIKGFNASLKNFNGMLFFTAIGVYESSDIIIGAPGKGNVLADNIYSIYGVRDLATGARYNENIKISSNFLSYDESGTVVYESGSSMYINTNNSVIGGTTPAERNYIAKNVEIYGNGYQFINNSLSLDINGGDNRAVGASTTFRFQGWGLNVANNIFCASLFLFISASNFSFTGNQQSTIPETSLVSITGSSNGVIGGDTPAEVNTFINDGGAISSIQSANISIKENSIRCSQVPYKISDGIAVPNIKVQVNNNVEFSGTASPGAAIYIYNDNTDCPVCNPVQYLQTITADGAGNWKITGNFSALKLIANATLNNNSSEFTQPVVSSDAQDRDVQQPTCGKSNGSITLKNLKNVVTVNWYDSNNQLLKTGITLDGVGAGTYYAKCSSGSCYAQTTNITITDKTPTIDATGIKKVNATCNNSNGSITGINLSNTEGMNAIVTWTNAAGDIVGHDLDLTGKPAGDYTLTLGVDNCTIPAYGPVTLTNEDIIITPPLVNSFQLCSAGNAIIPVVNPAEGSVYRLYDTEDAVTPLDEQANGKFSIVVTASRSYYISQVTGGCESARTKVDVSVGLTSLAIANIITPNADGLNDYWQIPGIENYPAATIKIFNRYGQNVFDSKGYARPFNGTQNGRKLPNGTYYYIINLDSSCGIRSGSLTIIR
jgi:gliding motility-associated-like protein